MNCSQDVTGRGIKINRGLNSFDKLCQEFAETQCDGPLKYSWAKAIDSSNK